MLIILILIANLQVATNAAKSVWKRSSWKSSRSALVGGCLLAVLLIVGEFEAYKMTLSSNYYQIYQVWIECFLWRSCQGNIRQAS